MDKLFHHHNEGGQPTQAGSNIQHQAQQPAKKEGEFAKFEHAFKKDEKEFKDYIKKDEEMQREGNGAEYGGLM